MKTLLFDFSRVILFPKDETYDGSLNSLHAKLKETDNYHFLDHFEFDEVLLDYLAENKSLFDLCVFTTGVIQEMPEVKARLGNIFKKIFTVKEVGFDKTDPQAYKKIAGEIGPKPEQILFIDDNIENLEAAKSAGLKTIRYVSTEQLLSEL
jgi:HAD superfamily hydrolase (TIGR01549 family)